MPSGHNLKNRDMKAIEILGIIFAILFMFLVVLMGAAVAVWVMIHYGDPNELPDDDANLQD